jgi:hypothetical protein
VSNINNDLMVEGSRMTIVMLGTASAPLRRTS